MGLFKDEIGNRYARLLVIARAPKGKIKRARWICRCDCGNEKEVSGYQLRNGVIRSCGCLRKETSGARYRLTEKERLRRLTEPRICRHCGEIKPPELFQTPIQHICNPCRSKVTIRTRDARKIKNNRLQSKYGITIEEYDKVCAEQDHKCKICGKVAKDRGSYGCLVVDHSHDEGHKEFPYRGIICGKCNYGLGAFGDSIETMKKAIAYLEEWEDRVTKIKLDKA